MYTTGRAVVHARTGRDGEADAGIGVLSRPLPRPAVARVAG
jgi:hypothetical protein